MRQRLRGSRLLRFVRFLPYLIPYAAWRLLFRVRPDRVLFLSDSHLGYTGNMGFLREAMLRRDPAVEIIGVFKRSLAARRPPRDAIRLPYLIATSSVIVLDDFYPLIYRFRIRRGARLVQIWHAAGAFKQVGHSRVGLPGGPTDGSEIHRNYTDAVVSGAGIVDDYAEAFGIQRERVRPWGMPRSDVFFDAERVASARADVRDRLGIAEGERLVVFAPTFRGNGQRSAEAAPSVDWSAIAAELGHGWRIAVRQHPFVAKDELPTGIVDAASIGDMNDLLMATDVLVTDYSSSIFEFAMLRRPIVFYVPDLGEYAASRAFYRPFEHYAIGPVVTDPDDLADALALAEVDGDRLAGFVEEFCSALDGGSSDRIAAELLPAAPRTAVPGPSA